jgi:mono/diheme cytochrome c family protein
MRSNFPPRRLLWVAAGVLLVASSAPAQDGKDIYLDKCSVCHGADGLGNTAKGRRLKVKSIKTTVVTENEAAMIKIVTDGKGTDMDSYKSDFSKDQIKALVDYYRSLAK